MNQQAELHPDPITRWFHRRVMAYISLVAAIAYPFGGLVVDPEIIKSIAGFPYFVFGSVIGLYIGSSVWETAKIAAMNFTTKK